MISRRSASLALIGAAIVAGSAGTWLMWRPRHEQQTRFIESEYVGSKACAACHPSQTEAWRQSQHAAAMAEASQQAVLGRFDGSALTHSGMSSRFFRRDEKFFVRTDGADAKPADFQIEYTFGISPLQQYLIRLAGGRLQAFGAAWDSRPAIAGGQRWFHLYPHERFQPGDPLHWTGLQQNWNFMCADCHSTHVQKGYNAETREFRTTWSEIAVGCESCHGPASAHVALARTSPAPAPAGYGLTAVLDERRGVSWATDPSSGRPVRSQPRPGDREIEVCARCHSRRSQITDRWKPGDPLEDGFRPSAIEPGLFYSDGQQRDEVYNYTSFLQSKMYAKGVTCADCHEPHSGKTRLAGNALCAQCHEAAKYDAPGHHFHRQGSDAAACAACHMPARTYMQIDPRRDHSFRVPRPDRTTTVGVPNACTSTCHSNRSGDWAAREIQRRTGRSPLGFQTFADAFSGAEHDESDAIDQLRVIAVDPAQPAVVRASALERLATTNAVFSDRLDGALRDPHPMVRRAALAALAHADPAVRVRAASDLLVDPIRTVRIQAAMNLADVTDRLLSGKARSDFDRAFAEFLAEQQFNADRPEAQTTLGTVWLARGQLDPAVAAFREAIRLDRTFMPAHVNLADALQSRGDEAAAERILRDGLAVAPKDAALHYSLGLSFVRQKRTADAMKELDEAVRLDPAASRFTYTYAVALHDTGKPSESLKLIRSWLQAHPNDREMRELETAYGR